MNLLKISYAAGVLKGLQNVLTEVVKLQEAECRHSWNNSTMKNLAEETCSAVKIKLKNISKLDPMKAEKNVSEIFARASIVFEGLASVIKTLPVGDIHYNLNTTGSADITDSIPDKDYSTAKEHKRKTQYSSKTSEEPRACIMNESDVVFQHESRLRTEVAAHVNPISGKIQLQNNSFLSPAHEVRANVIVDAPLAKKSKKLPHLNEKAKERAVPASRIARVVSFGTLAAGLGLGTVAELTRRTFGFSENNSVSRTMDSAFITPANAERIVDTLCKVRGAALKIGQIFSIQDNNVINPELQTLFERVRQSADFMPTWQVENVMKAELGSDWRDKFQSFEMKPFAAASIGQVHCGVLIDGREVAVKIQYPGVAKGIESDIDNLMTVLKIWNMFPPGVFIDNLVDVAKRELSWEVDYKREAECTRQFKKLLESHPEYYVPTVIDELCSGRLLTTELIDGIPVDKCVNMSIEDRCRISMLIQSLLLKEMFEFRFMQTDPNWSNFFYDPERQRLILLDFGASRTYDKKFIDKYLQVVKAALDEDRGRVLQHSESMGFLTGFESKVMKDAHVDAVMILGEILRKEGFDFGGQNTINRIQDLVPTIIHHRLCPPPEEIYSLHRKLSGAFLLHTKLKTKLSCHDLFMEIYNQYIFDEN